MTGPEGNSEFCFPSISMRRSTWGNLEIRGKQNSLFPNGPVIKVIGYLQIGNFLGISIFRLK